MAVTTVASGVPSRRTLLAALAAGFAGCGGRSASTPTVTPLDPATSTPTPQRPSALVDALGSSRFEANIVCPGNVPCFHLLEDDAYPGRVVVPGRESVTAEVPTATMTTYNLSDERLVLGTPVRVSKWTGIYWAPTHAVDVPNDVVVLEPGETVERTVTMDGRGDGTYAVVEAGYFGDPREPPTVQEPGRPRRLAGERSRFGALFEVVGSDWTPSPDPDVPAERDDSTLLVRPDRSGERELVLELSDQSEGIPLIPETVTAHPPTKQAVFGLTREGIERVRLPTDGTAMWYLENGLLSPLDITPDRAVRLDDIVFHATLE